MAIRINRTRKTSPTARNLAASLTTTVPNTKRLKLENSTWRGTPTDLLINWGSTQLHTTNAFVLNPPTAIANSVNKLTTFGYLREARVSVPRVIPTSTSYEVISAIAEEVYHENVDTLLLRTTATGHGGEGIHVLTSIRTLLLDGDDLEDLDDYYSLFENYLTNDPYWSDVIRRTKFVSTYFKARDEFRVHVFLNSVIHTQRKGLRTDDQRPENPNFFVRNHENGFVFQINDITIPPHVLEASVRAVDALGLHFGAVDVRYNQEHNTYCILEVNSAPALTGTTLEKYTEAFTNFHTALQSN